MDYRTIAVRLIAASMDDPRDVVADLLLVPAENAEPRFDAVRAHRFFSMSEPERPVGIVFFSAALSAIPTLGGPIQTLFDELYAGRRSRMESTAREIAEAVGQDRMVSRLLEDPRLEVLMGEALEAAARTGFEAKRLLLGRAVASALLGDDEAVVDTSELIVTTLAQLEPMHIRALIQLEKQTDRNKQNPRQGDRIAAHRGSLAVHRTLTEPVVATLIYTGVATPGITAGPPMVVREITDFGRLVLDHLRAVAQEELERLAE